MPEGNMVHRLARDVADDLQGERVTVTSPNGRFTQADLVSGERVTGAHAVGKHLLIDLGERSLHIHLGRFGRFRRTPAPHGEPKATVRLRLATAKAAWDLTGAIQCDLYDAADIAELGERIGGDPLAGGPRAKAVWERFHDTDKAIGAVLLDQRIFAGIGNIYRAEILFMLHIDPLMPASAVDKPTFERIWRLAKQLMQRGVEANRIVTLPGATGSTPRRKALHVYKQKRCRVCDTPIRVIVSGARKLYYCPVCQPAWQHDVAPRKQRHQASRGGPRRIAPARR